MKTTKVAETSLPTPLGTFRLFGFQSEPKTENVLALVMGKPNPDEAALVRIHSQCLTGDVFGSERCDCGDQLHFALSTIAESGSGLLIYQLQEGRGIGLMNVRTCGGVRRAQAPTRTILKQNTAATVPKHYFLCKPINRSAIAAHSSIRSFEPTLISRPPMNVARTLCRDAE